MPPVKQGLSSTTFTQPPLDGSLCLPAIFDLQGSRSAKHPLFVYEESPGSLRTILWKEGIQAMHRATEYIRRIVGQPEKKPVIAILAASDTITFATFLAGALRTGWIIFPISTRNSVTAVTALLRQTESTHIFVSAENHIQLTATAALKESPDVSSILKCDMPQFEDLYSTGGVDLRSVTSPLAKTDIDGVAVILHSSGSTAFPKPIALSHNMLILMADGNCHGEIDLTGSIIAFHGVPMFHGMGFAALTYPTGCGMVLATFKPQSPAVIPNPDNVIRGAVATGCDYAFATPVFLESWSLEENYVESLTKMKGVIFGGGPLSKDRGDYLASRGVNLFNVYALTQTMLITSFLEKPLGMDWQYLRVNPIRKVHYVDYGDDEYEIVVLPTDTYTPAVSNIQINGQDGFATGDLASFHPSKDGYFRIVGRTDDQIMHVNGEKTNPTPLEKILNQDPLVADSVMFGRGRFSCGVLVQPKLPFSFDPTNVAKLTEFRSLIWPTIEKMNAFAPSHSRLFKEMIIVTSPGKPFHYTPKGTPRRQTILNEYAAEIEAAYAAVDESSQGDIPGPVEWSKISTEDFLRAVVVQTLREGQNIGDDVDLFESGLDSLQATWIRNSVLRALRESHPSVARSISPNLVYDHPSISLLARYVYGCVAGTDTGPTNEVNSKRQELRALVDKYTQSLPTFNGSPSNSSDGAVILLTGSTGSLGSNTLAKLLENPTVKRVYTLSRPSLDGTSSKERHLKAFEREALNANLLNDARVRFIEGDPSRVDFAIERAQFEELQASVTHVIHNGWRVDFNVSVASFESNIRSVRNFVDFSLRGRGSTPARIIFISSVGVFQKYSANALCPESQLAEPDSAIGIGYSESKWISEQILNSASSMTPVSTTVVRCGQMTGGCSGAWNQHEWFPSLIRSSISMRMLPDADGIITWIGAVDAAGAVVDMLNAKDEEVLHIVHPRPVTWTSIISAFSKFLGVPVVPYQKWLSSLEESANAVASEHAAIESAQRSSPALRLLPFFREFRNIDNEHREALGPPRMSCEKSYLVSRSLQSARPLSEQEVERWVGSWKKSGFL